MESLHPSLRRCLQGSVLRHPLINQPYDAQYNALYNRRFDDTRYAVRRATASRNWADVIRLHARPFRATALWRIARLMGDDQYWRMVAQVWTDADNQAEMQGVWINIWTADRPDREQVMTETEHNALAGLPESEPGVVTIYGDAMGMSWRISRHAITAPLVTTAMVTKRDIQAYFMDRRAKEELVVLPLAFAS